MVRAVREQSTGDARLKEAIAARVHALGNAHDLLVDQDWEGVPLRDVLMTQVQAFDVSRFEIAGPTVILTATTVQYLSMAFFELATNAAKYGALSAATGKVSVEWDNVLDELGQRRLSLTWRETGGPRSTAKNLRIGFGRRVLEQLTPAAMGGSASLEFLPEGIVWKLTASDAFLDQKRG